MKNTVCCGLTLLLIYSLASGEGRLYPRADRTLTRKEEKQVRQTLRTLTLDEKIGQMIVVNTNAVFMNRDSEAYKKLLYQVTENRIGGFILSRSDVWATAILTNRLQELAKVPLLISADLEMGPGMRLNDTTWWPPNMAVGATEDAKYARLQGSATAREARAAGINWLYAPVADVNNNAGNPVINVRSYGEDPQMVAAFAAAFIEGAQSAGALATAKHFPGHGDTVTDSHLGLPVVDVSKERLNRLELVPFRAAIASRVGAIMSAHIALPQIEPEPVAGTPEGVTLPATLSSKILTGLLREELSFKGLIVTDALEMAGIAARYDPATSAVQAIRAGADMILKSPDTGASIHGIKQAVARGEISESRIDASVERILRAKAALGLFEKRSVDLNGVDSVVSDPEFVSIAQDIADRSITLVRDEQHSVPIGARKALTITFTDTENRILTRPFIDELQRAGAAVDVVGFDTRSTDLDLQDLRTRLSTSDAGVVIYCVSVETESSKGTVALPRIGLLLFEELRKTKVPLIVISFGNPYLLMALPDKPAYIAAYSSVPVSQRAAARALLGLNDITGKLPITLPGLHPRGHGITIKRRLKAAVEKTAAPRSNHTSAIGHHK